MPPHGLPASTPAALVGVAPLHSWLGAGSRLRAPLRPPPCAAGQRWRRRGIGARSFPPASGRTDRDSGGLQTVEPDPFPRLLLWGCEDECHYRCTHEDDAARRELGIPQYHGKWAFARVLGMQEIVSYLASVGSLRICCLARTCEARGSVLAGLVRLFAVLWWFMHTQWASRGLTVVDFHAIKEEMAAQAGRPVALVKRYEAARAQGARSGGDRQGGEGATASFVEF